MILRHSVHVGAVAATNLTAANFGARPAERKPAIHTERSGLLFAEGTYLVVIGEFRSALALSFGNALFCPLNGCPNLFDWRA